MLQQDLTQRITADWILAHPWFLEVRWGTVGGLGGVKGRVRCE